MTKKRKQAIEINFFYFALKETCFFVYFYVIYTFKMRYKRFVYNNSRTKITENLCPSFLFISFFLCFQAFLLYIAMAIKAKIILIMFSIGKVGKYKIFKRNYKQNNILFTIHWTFHLYFFTLFLLKRLIHL